MKAVRKLIIREVEGAYPLVIIVKGDKAFEEYISIYSDANSVEIIQLGFED